MCRGFESHPSSSFFFSEKKELFGLVASPFFLVIEKSFHVCTLVHWVSRGQGSCVWRFVDEHGVHGHNVWSSEALDIVQHLRQAAVLEEHWVILREEREKSQYKITQ